VVVVPVKDAAAGKSRLSGVLDERSRAALARAMALDTIAAAAGCEGVGAVVVVTSDEVVAAEAAGVLSSRAGGAALRVMAEPSHAGALSGLDAAATAGVAYARTLAPAAPVAVLLGDLPALRPEDLGAALAVAGGHRRAMVADSPGTGTTLLALASGEPFDSRFGEGSAAAHAELGFVALAIEATSTLRRDIDLPADLDALRALDPGPQTKRLLDRLFPDPVRGAGRPA
jgi:2-phospho-L-lactate guanylyltransferase